MPTLRIATIALAVAIIAMPAVAQTAYKLSPIAGTPGGPPLTDEQKADNEQLREMVRALPTLPMLVEEIKITPTMTIEGISAAAGDKNGNIYIIHRPADKGVNPVIVVDAHGKFLRSWGKGLFTIPHGIRIDPQDNVWTDDAHTSMIYKFTPEGRKLLEISVDNIPDPNRPFCGSTDVAFAKNGHVFVSDGYCNGRFIEYSADGKKIREWGKRGKGRGEFNNAHDIAIHPDGRIFVADRENGRLQWFDAEGKYLGEHHFGGQLFSVAISNKGEVYVGSQPHVHLPDIPFGIDSYVLKFDPASDTILGKIKAPAHQLSVGPDGTLYPGTLVDKKETVTVIRPQ
jgi:DNA-binding beta-propeller fold protein YncE